jgi:hypothetical protein
MKNKINVKEQLGMMTPDQVIETLETRLKVAMKERNPTEVNFLVNMHNLYYNQMAEIWKLQNSLATLQEKIKD